MFYILEREVQTKTYYVVGTRVEVAHHSSRCSNGAVLVEGMHVTQVNVQETAGIDAQTSTDRVAAQVEVSVAHVSVRQTIAGVLPRERSGYSLAELPLC